MFLITDMVVEAASRTATLVLATILLLTGLAMPLFAQMRNSGDPPEKIEGMPFREFANSRKYFDKLAEETLTYEVKLGACASPVEAERIRAGRPQVPTTLPGQVTPPQWMEVLKIKGCEKPVTRSVLVLYLKDKLAILPLINGTALSRFDVILQRDVITTLIPTERVMALRAGCPKDSAIRILDTRTISKDRQKDGLDWDEEWHLANCKGEKDVQISYKFRDGKGTNFTIRQQKSN